MKLDDILSAPTLSFHAGEEPGPQPAITEQIAHRPMGERQHSSPLAENDNFARLFDYELPNELAQFTQLGGGKALKSALIRTAGANRRPETFKLKLSHSVGYDSLGCEQAHQFQEFGLGERSRQRSADKRADWLNKVVMRGLLCIGHLHGNASVGARRQLIEHVLSNPANHAVPKTLPNGVEVSGSNDFVAPVGTDRMH